MLQFRDANYAKVSRCQRWPVYSMRMQIWFGSRLFWTTRAHSLTKMRKLHPKSREREWLRPWLQAARRSSWPNSLASSLILRYCRFLMLRRCIQVWKSFKLLSVSRIILKHMNMYKWRDIKRLQARELCSDSKMKISSSKSRSEEGSKSKCLSINKMKDLLSMKVFMKTLSLLRNSQRCVALKSDTCLWILFSWRFFSKLSIWIMCCKSWCSRMMLFNIVTSTSFRSSLMYFVTTKPVLFAFLTLVETFILSMTHSRLIKAWLKHWKFKKQGRWQQIRIISH